MLGEKIDGFAPTFCKQNRVLLFRQSVLHEFTVDWWIVSHQHLKVACRGVHISFG